MNGFRIDPLDESTDEMMPPILVAADLAELAAGCPRRETFGPQSARPLLAIRLAGVADGLSPFLRDLPCPVIGVGPGDACAVAACDVVLPHPGGLCEIARNIARAPIAAMALVQHLRASADLSPSDALTAESFAYATLQQGPEFVHWLREHGTDPRQTDDEAPPVLVDRVGDRLRITLNRPSAHNAVSVAMRDALAEALDLALADTDIARDVAEFGKATDPATAHWVRSLRLPARRLTALGERLHVHVQGATIGAGVEMAAFAYRLTAASNAWFQLPELKYGLIPGAGGTASLPRRIGRQRTAYMALSMRRISAATALEWGLVDAVV